MLISMKKKFIYTKTLKTAGTSIEGYFERFCMPERDWTPQHKRAEHVGEEGIVGHRGYPKGPDCVFYNHMSAAEIRTRIGERIWDEYFKFCAIRNPFSKVVSMFFFLMHKQGKKLPPIPDEGIRGDFESWVGNQANLPIDRDKYLLDGKVCMDDFIRHESLRADMERICNRLQVDWNPTLLLSYSSGHKSIDITKDI